MSVTLHITCATVGCGSAFDLDILTGCRDLVDLNPHGDPSSLWIEASLALPPRWTGTGSLHDYRAWCPAHTLVGRAHEASDSPPAPPPDPRITFTRSRPPLPLSDELRRAMTISRTRP